MTTMKDEGRRRLVVFAGGPKDGQVEHLQFASNLLPHWPAQIQVGAAPGSPVYVMRRGVWSFSPDHVAYVYESADGAPRDAEDLHLIHDKAMAAFLAAERGAKT